MSQLMQKYRAQPRRIDFARKKADRYVGVFAMMGCFSMKRIAELVYNKTGVEFTYCQIRDRMNALDINLTGIRNGNAEKGFSPALSRAMYGPDVLKVAENAVLKNAPEKYRQTPNNKPYKANVQNTKGEFKMQGTNGALRKVK